MRGFSGIGWIGGVVGACLGACVRDAGLGGDAVEQVEVAHRAQLVHLLAREGPGTLVLLGTGADVGVCG
jgi:hypothetical protein